MSTVRELTLIPVRAQPSLGKIFAQRAFEFVFMRSFELERVFERFIATEVENLVLSLSGDL